MEEIGEIQMPKIVAVEEAISETTHIGVLKVTQKKLAILTKVISAQQPVKVTMQEVAENLVNIAWQQAKEQGLVSDAMLSKGMRRLLSNCIRGLRRISKLKCPKLLRRNCK